MATETIDKGIYSVTFVADYFTLTTQVHAYTTQDASDKAIQAMSDHYGFDMESLSNDIYIEKVGE
jgi:hypothetical protein